MDPEKPDDQERRRALGEVAHALRDLHKVLVAAVRTGFEKSHGRVEGPGALLQLLLHDPSFAWLRPMSALIAEVDERLDDAAALIDAAILAEVRDTIEGWITDRGRADDFAGRYLPLLQSDTDLVIAHGALRKRLGALPQKVKPSASPA